MRYKQSLALPCIRWFICDVILLNRICNVHRLLPANANRRRIDESYCYVLWSSRNRTWKERKGKQSFVNKFNAINFLFLMLRAFPRKVLTNILLFMSEISQPEGIKLRNFHNFREEGQNFQVFPVIFFSWSFSIESMSDESLLEWRQINTQLVASECEDREIAFM